MKRLGGHVLTKGFQQLPGAVELRVESAPEVKPNKCLVVFQPNRVVFIKAGHFGTEIADHLMRANKLQSYRIGVFEVDKPIDPPARSQFDRKIPGYDEKFVILRID